MSLDENPDTNDAAELYRKFLEAEKQKQEDDE